MPDLDQLAKRISEARKSSRLSQMELASSIGVSDKSVSAYEKGRATPPLAKLRKIAEATGHPLKFFTDENKSEGAVMAKIGAMEKELSEIKKILRKNAS